MFRTRCCEIDMFKAIFGEETACWRHFVGYDNVLRTCYKEERASWEMFCAWMDMLLMSDRQGTTWSRPVASKKDNTLRPRCGEKWHAESIMQGIHDVIQGVFREKKWQIEGRVHRNDVVWTVQHMLKACWRTFHMEWTTMYWGRFVAKKRERERERVENKLVSFAGENESEII